MSQGDPGVVKRAFLKRGTRMPISRIPDDPAAACVEPIKNPVKKPRDVAEFDTYDENDEPVVVARKVPAFLKRPQSAKPLTAAAHPRPVPVTVAAPPPRPVPVAAAELCPSDLSDSSLDFAIPARSVPKSTVPVPAPVLLTQPAPPPKTPASAAATTGVYEQQLVERSQVLEAEIARFKTENEKCRKLRVERDRLLEETGRQQASLTVEREKFYEEKRQFELTIGRDGDRNERVKLLLRDLSAKDADIASLKDKLAGLETETAKNARLWKTDRERLESRNRELEGKIKSLEQELKVACKSIVAGKSAPVSPPHSAAGAAHAAAAPTPGAPAAAASSAGILRRERLTDGREDVYYSDGRKEILFPSGLRKVFHADGSTVTLFNNGDRKEVTTEGTTIYFYRATGAKQTTHPNGLEVVEFSTGQVERHFPDGTKEIIFPNGAKKSIPTSAVH